MSQVTCDWMFVYTDVSIEQGPDAIIQDAIKQYNNRGFGVQKRAAKEVQVSPELFDRLAQANEKTAQVAFVVNGVVVTPTPALRGFGFLHVSGEVSEIKKTRRGRKTPAGVPAATKKADVPEHTDGNGNGNGVTEHKRRGRKPKVVQPV